MVAGEGASGLIAQSISGGGGAGGDSKAHSTINGDAQYSMAASLSFGGSGGGGGAPGTADVENLGLVIATGESGAGLIAQTIGAGGGIGGSGDGSASAKGDSTSATTEIALGGKGGDSGDGGTSNVANAGGILTLGDGGYGMFAQSIAGKGGGAAGTQHGGALGFTLNIGGAGGNGGRGGDITATNSGSIATFGADSAAIMVQSVGGSGGGGGSSVGTINVTNTGTIGTVGQSSEGVFAQSIGGGGGKGGAASSSTNSGDATLAFGVGGDGGASGDGGAVNVYNTGGGVITTGGMADGIIAQSAAAAGSSPAPRSPARTSSGRAR